MDPNSSPPPAIPPIKTSANLDEILDSLQNQLASAPPTPGPSQVPSPLSAQTPPAVVPASAPEVTPAVEVTPPAMASVPAPEPQVEMPSVAPVEDTKQFEMEEKPLATAQPVEVPVSSAPIATASLKEDPTFKEASTATTADTATPVKKGFQLPLAFNPKVAVATFGLFIALVGGVAAYLLQSTNQDIRQQASSGSAGCTTDTDNCAIGTFKCTNNVSYECIQYSVYCNSNQGVWRSNRGNACTTTPPTGGGGGGGGTNVCKDGSGTVTKYVKYVCPGGCPTTTEGGITARRCYQFHSESTSPISMGAGECGQVDMLKGNGEANSTNFCGIESYTCDAGYCQPQETPPPTAPPTPTPPPVTLVPPACGTVCTTESLCDSVAVKLVPKYISSTRLYTVIDKVTLGGSTIVQEGDSSLSYGGGWGAYGPVAGYLGGAVTIKWTGALSSGTSPSVNFYVNGPSFDVYTDKGPNRSGYDVYINGVKIPSTGLDDLYNAGTGDTNTLSNYIAHKVTITVPGYEADKYTCATVGSAKACRLTSNPTSATCTPGTATPTPSAPPLACLNISKDVASPVIGSSMRFTCGQVAGVTKYEFRYKIGANGQAQTLASTTASSNVSVPLTIADGGTYKVQCRPCVGTACTNWESNW